MFHLSAGESPRPRLCAWVVPGVGARFRPSQALLWGWEVGSELRKRELGTGRLCDEILIDRTSEKSYGRKAHRQGSLDAATPSSSIASSGSVPPSA